MATVDVSLSEPMEDWVEAQVRAGAYGDAGEYVRGLIRRDQERFQGIAELQRLIIDGFESGISDRSMVEVLDTARRQVRAPTERGSV